MISPEAADGADDRGQSLNDFVIGVGLFLLVIGYTFAFLPTVFQPFLEGGAGSTQPADRAADYLAKDALAENASEESPSGAIPGMLNATCTETFFDGSAPPDFCRFATTDVNDITALPPRLRVNVTLTRDGETRFDRGPSPTGANDVARAIRVVTLDGKDHRLVVRVW